MRIRIDSALSCLVVLVIALLPSSASGVSLGPFISRQALDDCEADLAAADGNNDLKLTSEEYVNFVAIQTSKAIDSKVFANLPVKFVLVYYWVACACAEFEGQDSKCCVGDAAHIKISEQGTVQPDVYAMGFCSNVADAIEEELPTTPSPTLAPSLGTSSPSQSPTTTESSQSPTSGSSQSPTVFPSQSPTMAATTLMPSTSPSTRVPSMAPTVAIPTMPPTFENLLSVSFLYGLTNNRGLSADEIFNMVNNTLRTGLEIATRTVTIDILNTTFPQRSLVLPTTTGLSTNAGAVPPLSGHRDRSHGGVRRHLTADIREAMEIATIELYGPSDGLAILKALDEYSHTEEKFNERPDRSLLRFGGVRGSGRRLVFFTDQVPVDITRIVDNPTCSGDSTLTRCAIVSSVVSVILEGEDPGVVRTALLEGLRQSIADGSFGDAIPPEHQ